MTRFYKGAIKFYLFFVSGPRAMVSLEQKRIKHQIEVVKQLLGDTEEPYIKMILSKMVIKLQVQQNELKLIKKKYPLFNIKGKK